jgi:hypothetical protein
MIIDKKFHEILVKRYRTRRSSLSSPGSTLYDLVSKNPPYSVKDHPTGETLIRDLFDDLPDCYRGLYVQSGKVISDQRDRCDWLRQLFEGLCGLFGLAISGVGDVEWIGVTGRFAALAMEMHTSAIDGKTERVMEEF